MKSHTLCSYCLIKMFFMVTTFACLGPVKYKTGLSQSLNILVYCLYYAFECSMQRFWTLFKLFLTSAQMYLHFCFFMQHF